ncbi:unnamed protein product [Urochloa decumbens]|uniref:F-box associated domain-containing protein n=1 Tax=Urochloa decumbens TaxID=240449 RepID=A0ABC8VQI9_9POAL
MTTAASRDINVRLPCAAVLRSRAVCKAWRRITSSAAFVAGHARRRPLELILHRQRRHGLSSSSVLETIPLATLDEPSGLRLRVLQHPEHATPRPARHGYSGAPDYSVSVCNPVTRQWAEVHRPPGTWVLSCGFYAHKQSGEHRVLWLSNDHQQLPMDHGPCPEPKERGKIVAFDTLSETFRRMPRPPRRREGGYCREFFLLEVGGMLAMADFLNGSMDLWVMEDYDDGASWRRRIRLPVDRPSQLRRAYWALGAGVEGRDVILVGDHGRCGVALYDVTGKSKAVKQQIQLGTYDCRDRSGVFVFRGSIERHAFFDLYDSQGIQVLDQQS